MKNLEDINIITAELLEIKEEINEIHSLAKKLAENGSLDTKIIMNVLDTKEEEKEEKVTFDEDGSLILPGSSSEPQRIDSPFGTYFIKEIKLDEDKPNMTSIEHGILNSEALEILGILLRPLMRRKQIGEKKLKKLLTA